MAQSSLGHSTNKDGPLAGLDERSYKYNSFIYPLNLGQPGAGLDHYIIFFINETSTTQYQTRTVDGTPPPEQAVINRNAATDESLGVTGNRSRLAGVPGVTAPLPGRPEQRGQSTGTYVPIRRIATSIALPMPEDIQVNYSADWESMEMEETAAVMDAIGGEGSITEVLKAIGIRAGVNITNKMEAVTRLSLKDAFSGRGRVAINPHLEAIFKGIHFRNFSFNWKFTAQNEKESENINNIISAFKFYSAPEIATGFAGRFWIYPAEFDITFISHGEPNAFVHKISTCALKRMNVNYTPFGAWSAHRQHEWGGSPPTGITMSLEFMELEIMQKQRILEGY